MYRLSRLIALVFSVLAFSAWSQNSKSPHGKDWAMDCATCHVSDSWKIADLRWDHAETGFELEGQHAAVSCASCHEELNFTQATADCQSCHVDVHQGTTGNDCARCHTTAHWLISDVQELHEANGFPLDGAHFTASCTECHRQANELVFERLGGECVACHQQDFLATTNPNHQSAGFGTDCASCHDPLVTGWGGENFHLFFPLEGGHDNVSCTECHTTGNYADASPECSSCHMTDFTATTNPNHAVVGLGTDCASCHDPLTGNWSAFINHDFFPLQGSHNINDCAACHNTGNLADASPECASCHMADYNATSNPNHSSQGFPTDCALCHSSDGGWTPASFTDHDAQYFPIYSGNHRNEWNACTDCHTDPNNYALFSCIDCHEHSNQNELANDHDDVNGYVFNSAACYQCHPDGDD